MQYRSRGPRGLVANVLDGDKAVTEFERLFLFLSSLSD